MDFELSKEQEEIRAKAKEFAEKVIRPATEQMEKDGKFPHDVWKKIGENGFVGVAYSKKYEGLGLDYLSEILVIEEFSKVSAAVGVTVSAHTTLSMTPCYEFGSEELREKYMPLMTTGKKLCAFACTEAEAGTDILSLKTKAELDGNEYVINGEKLFIANGSVAGLLDVFARTEKGISVFLVEVPTDGFSYEVIPTMGLKGIELTRLKFDNVRVPKENLIGKEGDGAKILFKTMDISRVGIAAQALGIAEAAVEETYRYLTGRKQFGVPLTTFQGLRWRYTEMVTKVEAARYLVYKAAWLKDRGKPNTNETCMAKIFAPAVAVEVTRDCVQLHGGRGYAKWPENIAERLYRDSIITGIYEGTTEAQRITLAANLLRKPPRPSK